MAIIGGEGAGLCYFSMLNIRCMGKLVFLPYISVMGSLGRYILDKTKARQVKVAPMSQRGHGPTLGVVSMSRRDIVKWMRD